MADFTALKNAIQTYIRQNGNEEINGEKLQEILLSVVTTLGDSAINDLVTALANEVAARQNADGTLQQNITNEATARGNADTALGGRIDDEATARANGDTALSNRLGSTITAENTAADQIGAEAEARAAADTALQLLIDGITDNIENGYVYAGIATPSSTPATGKVFYLALTAGTYTNFGSTVVSQGINILKFNGSAWSLDAFIGIDDELTPSSNNLPKSGNVLENIIKNGSAFDLSAYNAVGGVLATYADLDAALTALNALPAVYKQGGMSFRFVLTSDNKYVQFRCMTQNFTTDVTQWQGVDDEPTAGSDNLVKSGGVAAAIQPLSEAINGEEEIVFDFSDYEPIAGLLDTDGVFYDHSVYGTKNKYIIIPFSSYQGRVMNYVKGDSVYMNRFAFLTSNNLTDNVLAPLCQGTTVYNLADNGNYDIPADCNYLYVYAYRENTSSLPTSIKINEVDATVATIQELEVVTATLATVAKNIGFINIHALNNDYNHEYTLADAISSIPASLRYTAKGIVYMTADEGESGVRVALFNSETFLSGWTNLSNWTVFNPKNIKNITPQGIGAVSVMQGLVNAGKVLVVGSDGNVIAGENTPAGVLVGYAKTEPNIMLHLKADSASEVSVGTGWSGDLTNGYTHTSGNTDSLVLGHTTENKKYLVTLIYNNVSESSVSVKIGNGYPVDPYNGTTTSQIGFLSDGGDLIITSVSDYSGTIKAKLQEITDESGSVESVSLSILNFDEGLMVSNISGFWNVAVGPDTNTMGKAVNASRNIAIGLNALRDYVSGSRNIGIGTFALSQLIFGKGNIGIGADSYYKRQGGNDNVAIGRACMGGSTETVNNNVCIGRSAGERASGDNNVCIGTVAGHKATSGCVFVGDNSGYNHSGGVNNTFIGKNAGTTGSVKSAGNWNTCVGPSTDFANNVNKSCAIGFQAEATKSSQNVIGSTDSVETKVFGDLVVHGTDGIDRKIVFNQDYSISWEVVS